MKVRSPTSIEDKFGIQKTVSILTAVRIPWLTDVTLGREKGPRIIGRDGNSTVYGCAALIY